MAQNITIPIKKPDGSIVKVSMSDFMAYKRTGVLPTDNSQTPPANNQQPSEMPENTQGTPATSDTSMALAEETPMDIVPLSEETELAVSTPNTHVFEEMAAASLESKKTPEAAEETEAPIENSKEIPEISEEMPVSSATENQSIPTMETEMAVPANAEVEMQNPQQDETSVSMPEPTAENRAVSQESSEPIAQESLIKEEAPQEAQEAQGEMEAPNSVVASPVPHEKKQIDPAILAVPTAGESALHEEPLEHNDLLDPTTESSVSHGHDAHIDAIISRANLTLSDELQERLRLLVQSRVKEVRDDDAVMVQAIKSASEGGIGLSEKDAMNLLLAIRTEMNLKPLHFPGISAPASAMQTKDEPAIDQKKRSYLPPATPLVSSGKPMVQDVVAGIPAGTITMPTSSANTSMGNEPAQSGIAYQTMGPIDEIAHFTLEDLHRLGNDKERVVSIMKTKFSVLKDESYVLFLDAVSAWKKCPLFLQYQDVIVTALNNRQTINQALQGNNMPLQMQDVDIIVELNKLTN